jgi:paraquat-inducible protein A
MQEITDVIVCEYCDTVHQKAVLKSGQRAYCHQCEARLSIVDGHIPSNLLPLTLAAIAMFLIANLFPILELQVQGKTNSVTLIGALVLLNHDWSSLAAMLILLTTIFSPLAHLCLIVYVILAFQTKQNLPGIHIAIRVLHQLLPWGMVEVFLLGIFVTMIKLSTIATIIPEIAMWAFIALCILITVIISIDIRLFWHIDDVYDLKKSNINVTK